jgi:hypothetical protein
VIRLRFESCNVVRPKPFGTHPNDLIDSAVQLSGKHVALSDTGNEAIVEVRGWIGSVPVVGVVVLQGTARVRRA